MARSRTYCRARSWGEDRKLDDSKDAGPPPMNRVNMSNRMNPPGIPMLYVAEDSETALDETVNGFSYYLIASLQVTRDLLIVDLADLPPIPSIFGADELHGRSRLQ